jgi:hypothetical protein
MTRGIDIAPGSRIAGRYEVQDLLGTGGMGSVYKVVDLLLRETIALKVLDADIASEQTALRFREEIRLARRVSHRNVCRIHEYGEVDGLRYISMAFVEGADLKRILREQGPLPAAEAYSVTLSIAAGLQAIHDEGIVHRDLKSSNVMLSRTGVVQLMDFGIAKDALTPAASRLTCTGAVVGTPEYMSPEQAMGRPVDARSDLYSLGIVVYELFTGRVPFHARTPVAVLFQQIKEPLRLDGEDAAAVPATLKPVLARALAKDPAERFASAEDLGEAILRASLAKGTADRTDVIVVPDQWPPVDAEAVVPRCSRPATRPVAAASRASRWLLRATLATAALTVVLLGAVWALEYVSGSAHPAPVPVAPSMPAAPVEGRLPDPTGPLPPASDVTEPTPASVVVDPVAPTATPVPAEEAMKGTVRVIAIPWADVSIDGRPIRSPALRGVRVSPGTHTVTLSHPDYVIATRVVVVAPGRVTELVVDFPEEGGRR